MGENQKVTVIVPVYNVKDYLDRCIKSIIAQTYKNLEIIIVDDGSTDGSSSLCDKYGDEDKRVKVIHKQNGGLSSARNAALEIMTGRFVTFIDSDDFVAEIFVEKLVNLMSKYRADVSVCDENRFRIVNNKTVWEGSPYKQITTDICLTAEEGLDTYMKQLLFDASACMKLYKSSLFYNIRYPVGYNFEDIGTTYKLFCAAKNIAFTPNKLYFYFQREGSILHTAVQEKVRKNILDGIKMTEQQKEFVVNVYPNLLDSAESRCFSMYCRAIGLSKIVDDEEVVNYCWDRIKKLRSKYLFNGDYRKKTRLAAAISYFGKEIFIFCYNRNS